MPTEKRNKLQQIVHYFLKKVTCTIAEFATLIGKLISACPAVEYGIMYTRQLETIKINALVLNNFDYNKKMIIPNPVIPDLKWWLKNLPLTSNKIKTFDFKVEICTDASNTGWGATDDFESIYGF